MGGIFKKPKTPKVEKVEPIKDEVVEEARVSELRAAKGRQGLLSTILTSGTGVSTLGVA